MRRTILSCRGQEPSRGEIRERRVQNDSRNRHHRSLPAIESYTTCCKIRRGDEDHNRIIVVGRQRTPASSRHTHTHTHNQPKGIAPYRFAAVTVHKQPHGIEEDEGAHHTQGEGDNHSEGLDPIVRCISYKCAMFI